MPPARTQAGAIRGPALGTGVAGGDGDVELDAVGAPRQPPAARIAGMSGHRGRRSDQANGVPWARVQYTRPKAGTRRGSANARVPCPPLVIC
jgi:hypothetical protein